MIKKSLIFLLLLFLLYNAALLIVNPPDRVSRAQNQWQRNVVKAQKYIYEKLSSRFVFVGTSLTFRLPDTALPKGSFNLAMAGTSAIEGMDIIKKSHAKPEAVFIETNFLMNEPDYKLSDNLFQPVLYSLRHWVPALRERNQPVNYCPALLFALKWNFSRIYNILNPFKKNILNQMPVPAPKHEADKQDRQMIIERMLKITADELDKNLHEEEASALIETLQNYIQYFHKNNIKVVFFEVPFHQKLYQTRYYSWETANLKSAFSPNDYTYIKYPFTDSIKTTDSVHLTRSSALVYCHYLSGQINQLLSKSK